VSARTALALALVMTAASSPRAAPARLTVGVLLPTTVADGEQRFALGQKFAAALGQALHVSVTARNFARYADLMQAADKGELDVGLVDGWIAAESPKLWPVALAVVAGEERQPWALVARSAHAVVELRGKRLALAHGSGGALDAQFVSNVIFERALPAGDLPSLTFVPSVESALKMFEVGSADAVLLPLPLANQAEVIYQSAPLPVTAVVSMRATAPRGLATALRSLAAIPPFDRFVPADAAAIASLRGQIQHGPPPRVPPLADAPPVRLDLRALVTFRGLGVTLPSFAGYVAAPNEMPDD
jgi:ABC-type amino acid transport substrate-binding protein